MIMSKEALLYPHFQLVSDLTKLASRIKLYNPDLLIAPVRGGLVIATYLSHLLDDTLVAALPKKYGTGWYQQFEDVDINRILIIDDIVDTGYEMERAIQAVNPLITGGATDGYPRNPRIEVKTAALFLRSTSGFRPDYVPDSKNVLQTDIWVTFPWENSKAWTGASRQDYVIPGGDFKYLSKSDLT